VASTRSFEALGAFQSGSHNLSGEGEAPERVSSAALTPGTFGVVSDLMSGDIDEVEQHGMYASIHQMRPFAVRVLAAGRADPMSLLGPLRAAVDRVDPDLPIFEAFTVRESALREKQVLDVLGRRELGAGRSREGPPRVARPRAPPPRGPDAMLDTKLLWYCD
jgi:hypothetical protein